MKPKIKIYSLFAHCGKVFSTLLMVGCLTLLTGGNFLVYSPGDYANDSEQTQSRAAAPTPAEEKTSSNNLVVQEEYIHNEHSFMDFLWLDNLLNHLILDAEKLQIVHYELISPPPRMA